MNTKLNKQTLITIGAILALATAIVGYQVYTKLAAHNDLPGTAKIITNDTYGVSFTYLEGEEAFSLIEPPEYQAGINKSYVILPTKAYEDYKNSEDAREAPAGINIFILTLEEETVATNTEKADRLTRLKDWAVKHDGLTQFSQKKAEPEIVEIDGVKALKYQSDGLYMQTIYLATYRNNVYMFVSQYNSESDMTRTTFDALLTSVSFD